MTLRKAAVVVACILLILCIPASPQNNPPNKQAESKGAPAPRRIVKPCEDTPAKDPIIIDLCKPPSRTNKEMELRRLSGESIWMAEHDGIVIPKATKDQPGGQIAWTCASHEFTLLRIGPIQSKPASAPDPRRPDFPFCPKLASAGKQLKGTILYSGPPVASAAPGCYMYEFKIDDDKPLDPHVIITDPNNPGYNSRLWRTQCDFDHRLKRGK